MLPSHQLIEGLINFAHRQQRHAPRGATECTFLAFGYILFSQHKSQLNLQFLTALMDIEGRLQFAASDVSPPPYIEQHFLD